MQNAFYQLVHVSTLEEAGVETVRRGGDTDTNAAMCGALVGAVDGREAVPLQWRQMVTSCRPMPGLAGVQKPRPAMVWPADVLTLAELLVMSGANASRIVAGHSERLPPHSCRSTG